MMFNLEFSETMMLLMTMDLVWKARDDMDTCPSMQALGMRATEVILGRLDLDIRMN